MTDSKKPIKVTFAPGAFDQFDGTQEELDELLKEIQELADNGELFERARSVDLEDLMEEDEETLEEILMQLDAIENDQKKTLH